MYQEQKFDLPELQGLAPELIALHLGLYGGYVKNFNALTELRAELLKDPAKNAHELAEITRRMSFEFDGMRLHEYFFSQWEGGASALEKEGALASSLARQYGSVEAWEKEFRQMTTMRGIGWVALTFDKDAGLFHNIWIGEHQQGHFAAPPIVHILDLWEHAYLTQFGTAGRPAYVEACFNNYNWSVMEERFKNAR